MDRDTYDALRTVINYSIEDERKHFEESDQPSIHIYHDLVTLENYANAIAKANNFV